ncbi:hypothetical protein HPB50_027429 [Hyalomma asiaticum]|uniref:Uncharacterized protein n=1 Tax=Hyalomma asiaticum TaxID=266040 RepID=A0ACB7SJ23_HYAAI|nr:hypothetical protein HPB50_027429 [Hyalomma asiaticum]
MEASFNGIGERPSGSRRATVHSHVRAQPPSLRLHEGEQRRHSPARRVRSSIRRNADHALRNEGAAPESEDAAPYNTHGTRRRGERAHYVILSIHVP